MVEYRTKEWLSHHERASSDLFRRTLYVFLRPLLSFKYSRYLSRETLAKYRPNLCLGSRGLPLESRRTWGSKYLPKVREAVMLVQGTGTGWDVVGWAGLRPRKIIATDMFPFGDSWEEIARYCYDHYRVPVDFRVSPIETVSFLERHSVDFIASDAVYEHCRDLPAVIKESCRILKPGGSIYASYGPLYYCAGGDHFSGRGGLETCFNHLLLAPEAYQRYLEAYREEVEDFQGGARYIELNLFSYLTTADYIKIFQEADLVVKDLILEVSPDALQFKKRFPDQFHLILNKYKEKCSQDDLLVKAHLINLQKVDSR
jgi:SAM-dependent methyltransferase